MSDFFDDLESCMECYREMRRQRDEALSRLDRIRHVAGPEWESWIEGARVGICWACDRHKSEGHRPGCWRGLAYDMPIPTLCETRCRREYNHPGPHLFEAGWPGDVITPAAGEAGGPTAEPELCGECEYPVGSGTPGCRTCARVGEGQRGPACDSYAIDSYEGTHCGNCGEEMEAHVPNVRLEVDERPDGTFVRSADVPGLHLVGSDVPSMTPQIEDAIKRLRRDNDGQEVTVSWLGDRELQVAPVVERLTPKARAHSRGPDDE